MNVFFDISWQLFHFLLIGILVIGFTVILSFFIKNKIFLLAVNLILIFGTMFFIEHLKFTTFEEFVSEHLTEESTVRNISITINDLSGQRPITAVRATIEDESVINDILEDFSEIELKKDENVRFLRKKYVVGITANNPVRENISRTTTLYLEMDSHYLEEYRIISESNHLKTIESLIESKEVEWIDVYN